MSNRKNNALEKKAGIGKIRSFFIDLMVFGLPLPNSYEPAEEEALQETAVETGQPDPIDLTERLRKAECKRRCRAVALCACLLAVLLGIGACKLFITPPDAQADPMDMNKLMKTYANEISAGSISVVGSDDTTVTIELNSTIPMEEGQKVLPELHIPQYIPEGYEYNGLNIQKAADGTYGATYNFTFNKNELIFKQMYRSGDAGSIVNLGLTLEMESGHGNLYYGEDGLTNINQMVLIENSGIRYIIYGTFEKEELKKMMESFELKPQK